MYVICLYHFVYLPFFYGLCLYHLLCVIACSLNHIMKYSDRYYAGLYVHSECLSKRLQGPGHRGHNAHRLEAPEPFSIDKFHTLGTFTINVA